MTDDQLRDILTKELASFAGAMNQRFDTIEKKLEEKADKSDVNRMLDLLDKIIKQQEIDEHERLAISNQLDRHDRWHHHTADKLGIKLDYQAE